MRRLFRYAIFPLAGLVLLLMALAGGISLPPVKQMVAQRLPGWTGGMVEVEGITGLLPWHLGLAHLVLRDPQGVWLEMRDADLRLGLAALLHKQLHVRSLSAVQLDYVRNPSFPPSPAPAKPASSSFTLPDWGVRIDSLSVSRLIVGPALFGQGASLRVDGKARLGSLRAVSRVPDPARLPRAALTLTAERLDSPAHLRLTLQAGRRRLESQLHYDEAAGGFATAPGGQPMLDPLAVDLSLNGPPRNLATTLHFQAGSGEEPLRADLAGYLDLIHRTDDLALEVHAPAMTPRPGMGWTDLSLKAGLHGPMLDPCGLVQFEASNVTAGGAGAGHVHLRFDGQQGGLMAALSAAPSGGAPAEGACAAGAHGARRHAGRVQGAERLALSARLDGLSLPGKAASLLAAAPLTLEAAMQPRQPDRPYELHLAHEGVRLDMAGHLAASLSGHMVLDIARLPDLAALLGQPVAGTAHVDGDFSLPLHQDGAMTAALDGRFGLERGPAQAVAMVGQQGVLHLRAQRNGDGSMAVEQVRLAGRAFQLEGTGQMDARQTLSARLKLSLPELVAAYPALRGHAVLESRVEGPLADMALQTQATAMLGVVHPAVTLPVAPLALNVALAHLPARPQGTIRLDGMLDNAPLVMHVALARQADGGLSARLDQLGWKGLSGQASLALPAGRSIPQGDVELHVTRLDGFSRLLGRAMAGHLQLGLHTRPGVGAGTGRGTASALHDRLDMALDGQFHMDRYAINRLTLKGQVDHLSGDPAVMMDMQLAGMQAGEATGAMQLRVRGPQKALAVEGSGDFAHVMQAPARFSLAALANIPGQSVRLDRLMAELRGDRLALSGPAVLHYGRILAIEHLAATLAPPHGEAARLYLDGTLKPQLGLVARLEHVTPALATPFVPALQATGVLEASARLRGSLAAPAGRVTLEGSGLRLISDATESLPMAALHAQADLDGRKAQLHADMRAGDPLALLVSGAVPLSPAGLLGLDVRGRMDLSIANAFLGSSGMGAAGLLALDMGVAGTLKQPRLAGTIQLHGGAFDHYGVGVHLADMDALVRAHGDMLEVEHLTARAGQGTLGLHGQVGVLHPGLPVDVQFAMDKAQPVQSDLLSEVINSRLHIYGQASTRLDVEGNITVPEASITLPDSMPASVPELEIITPEQLKPHPRPAPSLVIGLNVDFISPEKLFVRGHGLFAEMQGKLHVGGVSTAPVVTGGINLKRGSFNLAGINLNFTHGQVGFNGSSAAHKLDPTIDFRADRNADGTLASLLVRGYASDPKIDFTSTPSLPRDEVLAILLFGAHRDSLSATQLASLGLAVVQIGGGSAFDPLGKVRSTLGLDHLAIGGGSSVGNGAASLEAGKYVMKGVYVGAREGLSGKGAQAQVKVDLTKRLKLNTTVGTGGQVTGFTTPENDPGSSVGLSYGMDY